MNTTNLLVLTGITVIGGRWAQGKPFEVKVVIGLTVVIIMLYVIAGFAPEVANPLAALTLVAALLTYGAPLLSHVGGAVSNSSSTPLSPQRGGKVYAK